MSSYYTMGELEATTTDTMSEFEKIKFMLKYNPKVRNVKKPVGKCIYGRKCCYYHSGTLSINKEKCAFKNQTHCRRYLSERCWQWQLLVNKRFNLEILKEVKI